MEFIGRESEIELLRKLRTRSSQQAQMTVLTGRRRVGKTTLLREALDDGTGLYVHLPITRQSERTLCVELQAEVERVLGLGILGQSSSFRELFRILMEASLKRPFTLVLDEFQEFDRINSAVFSQVAALWDEYHVRSKMNLVVCGSINRLMNKIFFDDGEPLYGRNTASVRLRPFKVSLLKRILARHHPKYTADDLLALWTVTGGVARYVDMMVGARALTRKKMLDEIFAQGSSYLEEGRTILAEEFGPDYGVYFTILAAIASGATTSAELKALVGADVNGYLTKLERDYALVSKKIPLLEKETSKNCHYQIDDCFFRFWFRFVFKYRGLLELERYDQLRQIAARDFDVFSGYALERFFYWKFAEDATYTKMGAWWNRKGEEEIDLVCEDELNGTIDFFEIKRDVRRFDRDRLQQKIDAFYEKHPEKQSMKSVAKGLSLTDM
ncbi:MAG: ATP-binding protein [Kiritimatiellia bacterium]